MIDVEVEGQPFQFPDGTSQEVIGKTIRNHFGNVETPLDRESTAVADAVKNSQPEGKALDEIREPLATIVSSTLAEPLAGLAGIGATIFGGVDAGVTTINAVRDFLTIRPKTQKGVVGLKKVTDFVDPLGKALSGVEDSLGDAGNEAAGPLLGAIAKSIPTAILAAAGYVPVRRLLKLGGTKDKSISKAVNDAAPTGEMLKDAARGIYNELDNVGARVQGGSVDKLVASINQAVSREGIHPKIHTKSVGAVSTVADLGAPIPGLNRGSVRLIDIDTVRKTASDASRNVDLQDARMSGIVLDKIDDFMDNLKISDFEKSTVSSAKEVRNIGGRYRNARQLWNRARKSEILDEAFAKADTAGPGFEQGLRTGFRQIVNNKKLRKGFSNDEMKAMKLVVKGSTAANITKQLGRLGFSERQTSYMLLSAAGGSAIGSVAIGGTAGAAIGAVAIPIIGQVSKGLALKITRRNGELANSIVKAGTDGKRITEAYFKAVKASERSVAELTELLIRPGTILKSPRSSPLTPSPTQKLKADAMFFASFIQSQNNRGQQEQEN